MENPRQNIDDLEVPLFQETSIYLRNTFNQGQFSISRWFPRSISECRDIVIGLISQLLGLFHHAYIMLYQIKKPTKYDDYIILYNIIYNIYTLWLDSIRFSMIPVQKSSSDPWKNHEIHHETANPSGPSTWQPWVLVHFFRVITEFTGMHIRGETHDFPIVCKGFPSRNLHFLACKCPIFMIFLRFSRIFLCFSTFPICSYDFPAFSYGFSHLFPWSAGRNSPRPHGSPAPRRFEIHSVEPPVGSEEGGARVTVRGIGFGDATVTNQVGPLGSPGVRGLVSGIRKMVP